MQQPRKGASKLALTFLVGASKLALTSLFRPSKLALAGETSITKTPSIGEFIRSLANRPKTSSLTEFLPLDAK